MITILRHLLSIALLPLVMVVIIPSALRGGNDTRWLWSDGTLPAMAAGAGALLILVGFGLFAWCVALFARVGNGTRAP